MLKQLELSNFRIFDDDVTVRLRPITVLIGKNNAGKSSVIDFFLMLQRSLGEESKSFLEVEDFYRLKNKMTGKERLRFSLQTKENGRLGAALAQYLSEHTDFALDAEINHRISANVLYSRQPVFRGESEVSTSVGGEKLFSLSAPVTDDSRLLDFSDTRQRQVAESPRYDSETIAEDYCLPSLAQQIKAIRHISTARKHIPDTVDPREGVNVNYVGKAGENTLPLLRKLHHAGDKSGYEFIRPHLRSVLGISEITFEESGNSAECVATNGKTGAKAHIADFGFGVSRCLPVFVQGALMNHGTLIVEQPEARVHPTAQLELGSFFADLWTQKKVCSIIETHSDNILLRLQHLIAKGSLKPGDVSIAFFDIEDGGAVVKNLDIDKNGNVSDELPMEFFGADVDEALEMHAARHEEQPH